MKQNQIDTDGKPKERSPTQSDIEAWLISHLANILEINPDKVDIETPFDRYGLDSAKAIEICGDLQTWLEYNLEPTLLLDYPTITDVIQYLSQLSRKDSGSDVVSEC